MSRHQRAVEKQEREVAKAAQASQLKAQAAEDAKWAGTLSKKEIRAQEKLETKAAQTEQKQQKKEMKKALNDDDEVMMAGVKLTAKGKKTLRDLGEYSGNNNNKVTQFDLQQRKDAEEKQRQIEFEASKLKQQKILGNTNDLLAIENTNHILKTEEAKDIARYGAGNVLSARNIDAAVSLAGGLSGADLVAGDKAAQKRKQKRLYKDFEEQRLTELKMDYPDLKLSQLKEKCFAEFQRQNP